MDKKSKLDKIDKFVNKEIKTEISLKIEYFKTVIQNIIRSIKQNNRSKIITNNDYNTCYESVEKILNLITSINYSNIENELQYINNTLSLLIKNYGTSNFQDILDICIDTNFIDNNQIDSELYKLYKIYAKPINYSIINWPKQFNKQFIQKNIQKNKIIDDKVLIEDTVNLDSFDLMRTSNDFNLKISGLRTVIHDIKNKKTIVINCLIDDIILSSIENRYIKNKLIALDEAYNNNQLADSLKCQVIWSNFKMNLSLRDILVYNEEELYNKFIGIFSQINQLEKKPLNDIVSDFIGSECFIQRNTLIYLLMNSENYEFLYISYLLYDLLSNEYQIYSDTREQEQIFNSLPWNTKKHFKNAMVKTIEYTENLCNFNINKIPLEQQICLMKVSDNVKEKAMQKLKEIKSKSEDSGAKARHYLDGLLAIPFCIYRQEDILLEKSKIRNMFDSIKNSLKYIDQNLENNTDNNLDFIKNDIKELDTHELSNVEVTNFIELLNNNSTNIHNLLINRLENIISSKKKTELLTVIYNIKLLEKKYDISNTISINSNDKICNIRQSIYNFITLNQDNIPVIKDIEVVINNENNQIISNLNTVNLNLNKINKTNVDIRDYINNVNTILDNSVYGHQNAKRHIQRIIGQWINGENHGYCFGFEGPPGVGKTSLSKKGIANCLCDKNGNSRPFSFIALGGSSNGSLLDGHSYTYVGSTWGKIVDILMTSKCMNPIIFIDELDKVSRTEQGREIIGILTHLTDSTQNTSFQDKYFSNIDIDLSKALFIFSYNDVELIDKVLLDRIHRIKFDNLTVHDKIIIANKYIIPDLCKQTGLENAVSISDEIIKIIINNYTNESGVRKLKEILYEIISTINLDILKDNLKYSIPINVTNDMLTSILADYNNITINN